MAAVSDPFDLTGLALSQDFPGMIAWPLSVHGNGPL